MKTLIIGAGAIGCLIGAKLAQTGQTVTLVGRPHFADVVRAQGLHLHDERGHHMIRNIHATGNIAEAFAEPEYPYHLAILTVKSYDTPAVISDLYTRKADIAEMSILSLQNGVGNEEVLAEALGGDAVLAGTITTPVSVLSPGEVQVDRPNYTLGLSAWHSTSPTLMADATHHTLESAGFRVTSYTNPQGMKWTKLLLNMMTNASSAILEMEPGELLKHRELANLELLAWRETLNVMQRAQIAPVNLGSYPFQWLAPLVQTVPKRILRPILRKFVGSARGGKMPSLHIDLQKGRQKSEIDWLNGAVVHRGKEVGVATPVNELFTQTLHGLLGAPEEQEAWRHNVERLVEAARPAVNGRRNAKNAPYGRRQAAGGPNQVAGAN